MGDRICIMAGGQVAQIGAPLEVYARPATTFVATFLGSPAMNLLAATLSADRRALTVGSTTVSLPPSLVAAAAHAPAASVILGIRPEDLAPGGADGPLPAQVAAVEPLGADTILRLALPGVADEVLARVPRVSQARPGESLRLVFDTETAHLFDPVSQRRLH